MRLAKPAKAAAVAAHYRAIGADQMADRIELDLASQNRCIRCGRQLTDPVSVDRKIGPECRKNA